jgi:anti-sigma B factor antagonist
MPESRLRIEERRNGDVTTLILRGQVLVDDGDLAFRRRVHELVEQGRVKIIVDLGEVTAIDSSGVGMVAAKLKTVRERGGDIRLLHLTNRGQRLLGMLKLRTAFEVFEDEAQAVGSFARPTR